MFIETSVFNWDAEGAMTTKTPTSLVRVTFPGSVLPQRLILDGLILPIEPYRKRAMLCENCLRTGHTKAFCVVKPKCAKCGSAHITSDCKVEERLSKCFICGTGHNPDDRKLCPKLAQETLKKHQQLKKKLALSYSEAVKVSIETPNQYEILSSDDEVEIQQEGEQQSGQPMQKKRKTHLSSNSEPKKNPQKMPTPSSSKSNDADQGNTSSTRDENQRKPKKKISNGVAFKKKEDQKNQHPFISSFESIVKKIFKELPLSASWKQFIDPILAFIFDKILPLLLNHIPSLLSSFM